MKTFKRKKGLKALAEWEVDPNGGSFWLYYVNVTYLEKMFSFSDS